MSTPSVSSMDLPAVRFVLFILMCAVAVGCRSTYSTTDTVCEVRPARPVSGIADAATASSPGGTGHADTAPTDRPQSSDNVDTAATDQLRSLPPRKARTGQQQSATDAGTGTTRQPRSTETEDADQNVVSAIKTVAGEVSDPLITADDSYNVPRQGDSGTELPELTLEDVIASVHRSYPLVQAAVQERRLADGNQLAAWGEFDTKLKATSENGPLGFYETYRNSAGVLQPIYDGGELFAGYRNGGGDFEPWYKERETNDGGEFKGGIRVPLIRNRRIDSRRAALWRATYDQQIANPVIRASLVQFSREAGLAYWKWVAAGQKYQLGLQWLELARSRNDQVRRRVELQDLDPPELTDNERAIAKREAKLANARQMFQQAAVKLSLFLRDRSGHPVVPTIEQLPDFPPLREVFPDQTEADIRRGQNRRPELQALQLQLQRLRVDYSEACNLIQPTLDAQLAGSQDVGQPTSSKRDKSQFELEAALYFDLPLQRRKGRGKMHAVQAKMAQVAAKRRMVADKVAAEVQLAYAGLIQSRQETLRAREAVDLAEQMAAIERRKFEVGQSDLLKVALREQYAIEAAEEQISATYSHFAEFTEYAATLAIDRPSTSLLPAADDQSD